MKGEVIKYEIDEDAEEQTDLQPEPQYKGGVPDSLKRIFASNQQAF